MKTAVLFMDMPEHCDKCPCLKNINGINYCSKDDEIFKKIGKADAFYYIPKPDWCPLVELPKRIEVETWQINNGCKSHHMEDEWAKGWNACLDELEGRQ